MPRRRPLAPRPFGALLAIALGFVSSTAAAQKSAATPKSEPILFNFDLYAGLQYRVGSLDSVDLARGGGLFGLDVLVGPKPSFGAGVGYERVFSGRARADSGPTISEQSISWDTLWFIGRGYVYRDEAIALYLQLNVGPVWQHVDGSGTREVADAQGRTRAESYSCSASASAGLGLRGAFGLEISVSDLISFNTQAGVDHYRLDGDVIDRCAPGAGGSTLLGARAGFTFGTGRHKEEPPPAPSDRDKDTIVDEKDACPDTPGVKNPDPKKNGCPSDRDGDTILDEQDACPDQPGPAHTDPKKNGCPPSDRDGDTILDEQDACPDQPGPAHADPKKNGCPPSDRDGDKVVDEQDACPDTPGVTTEDPKTNGCPPDSDGDGILDDKDACPKDKGLPNLEDASKHGCPLVMFTDKEIVISQQVQFEINKAIIRQVSDHLLDEVASMIKDHAEILKLEVQGHTDNTGAKQHNKQLSQARADAVRKALVKRGVKDTLLIAKGYGQEQPIADNGTDEGKSKNRRVQFKIVEKKDLPPKTEQKSGQAPAASPDKPKAQAPATTEKKETPTP